MRKTWIAMCTVAVVAAGAGAVAGRAFAEDDPMAGGGGPPPPQKTIDGHALVKALTANSWTTSATSPQGPGTGTASFRLGADKTVLVQDYSAKHGWGPYGGLGVTKISDDGKTATMWWFNTMGGTPDVYTGSINDTGYELKGEIETGPNMKSKVVIKMVKKGEGFEFTFGMDGQVGMTDVYTKAK